MFEIGWTEMLVIAVVMIVVVGPKDLPRMLRTIGRMTGKMRSMAGDFRKQFDEALKEAELDDLKKTVDQAKGFNPASQIRNALNPMEKAAQDVRSGLDQMMKPKPVDVPKSTDGPQPAEPAKVGATAMPAETPAPVAPSAAVGAPPASAPKTPAPPPAPNSPTSKTAAGTTARAAPAKKPTPARAAAPKTVAKPAASKAAPKKSVKAAP